MEFNQSQTTDMFTSDSHHHLAGVVLVRVVSAVIFSVTFPGVGDTAPVTALELGGLAGHVGTAGLIWNIDSGKSSVNQSMNFASPRQSKRTIRFSII